MRNLLKEWRHLSLPARLSLVHEVVREVAEALYALHRIGIIHRDLKPEDILCRERQPLDLVITDFGVSGLLPSELEKVGTQHFKGTLLYAAPEELTPDLKVLTPAAGWWHLGMIAYEVYQGEHYFETAARLSEGHQILPHLILVKDIQLPPDMDARVCTLLQGLLTKDSDKRWGYPEVMAWLRGEEVVLHEAPAPAPSSRLLSIEAWLKAGFTPAQAERWHTLGFSPEKALSFRRAGIPLLEAETWVQAGFKDGQEVLLYRQHYKPEEAMVVRELGLELDEIQVVTSYFPLVHLLPLRGQPQKVNRLIRFLATLQPSEQSDLRQWLSTHLPPVQTFISYLEICDKPSFLLECLKRGISPELLQAWQRAGYTPERALEWMTRYSLEAPDQLKSWQEAGLSEPEIKDWRSENFSLEEALCWRQAGFSPKEAREWKFTYEIETPEQLFTWKQAGFSEMQIKSWRTEWRKYQSRVRTGVVETDRHEPSYEYSCCTLAQALQWH